MRRTLAGVVILAVVASAGWAARPKGKGADGVAALAAPTSTANTPVATAKPSPHSTAPVVPTHGPGTFTTVTVPGPPSAATGRAITYEVRVENGLGADTSGFAATVREALLGALGWQPLDKVRFVQLTPAEVARHVKPHLTITLASQDTVDKRCAPLQTDGEVSCGVIGEAVLNYRRWALGVPYYKGDLADYRLYMINHEVGHTLGHVHQHCPRPGARAPVMQQQTLGLQGCTAWPWPQQPAS